MINKSYRDGEREGGQLPVYVCKPDGLLLGRRPTLAIDKVLPVDGNAPSVPGVGGSCRGDAGGVRKLVVLDFLRNDLNEKEIIFFPSLSFRYDEKYKLFGTRWTAHASGASFTTTAAAITNIPRFKQDIVRR